MKRSCVISTRYVPTATWIYTQTGLRLNRVCFMNTRTREQRLRIKQNSGSAGEIFTRLSKAQIEFCTCWNLRASRAAEAALRSRVQPAHNHLSVSSEERRTCWKWAARLAPPRSPPPPTPPRSRKKKKYIMGFMAHQ